MSFAASLWRITQQDKHCVTFQKENKSARHSCGISVTAKAGVAHVGTAIRVCHGLRNTVVRLCTVIHRIPKWRPTNHSPVRMSISPLCLVNLYNKKRNFEVKMRQRGLINMQTKGQSTGHHFGIRCTGNRPSPPCFYLILPTL